MRAQSNLASVFLDEGNMGFYGFAGAAQRYTKHAIAARRALHSRVPKWRRRHRVSRRERREARRGLQNSLALLLLPSQISSPNSNLTPRVSTRVRKVECHDHNALGSTDDVRRCTRRLY